MATRSIASAARQHLLEARRRRFRGAVGAGFSIWDTKLRSSGSSFNVRVATRQRHLSNAASDSPGDPDVSKSQKTNEAVSGERAWTWSTPSPLRPGRGTSEIPVIPRVNLTVEEVVKAVEGQGATDVRSVDLRGKGTGMGDYMIFTTATTPLHMRRLANMVVHALKQRKLVNAMGITGAEGIDCDDWMLVDCDNLIVHFMTEESRQELDLESHWETVASGSALSAKRERGEEGHVEDPVDWEEDFGQEAAKASGRGVRDG